MKKSQFISLLLGITGMFLFGIGMCMCLLPEWNLFQEGIVMGCIGIMMFIITFITYRKMEHLPSIHLSSQMILKIFVAIIGLLGLGSGMSLIMVYQHIVIGIIIGMMGIFILLSLIPLCIGIKD